MINFLLPVMLAAARYPLGRTEVSNGRHHEHLAVELRSDSAKPYLTGLEIRQRRSDEMAGHLDRQGLQKSAVHDFDYQGQRLQGQCDVSKFRRPAVPKGTYHHEKHISDR